MVTKVVVKKKKSFLGIKLTAIRWHMLCSWSHMIVTNLSGTTFIEVWSVMLLKDLFNVQKNFFIYPEIEYC